jgi:hypothetical protein
MIRKRQSFSRVALLCGISSLMAQPGSVFAQPVPYEKDDYYRAKGAGIGVRWEVPRPSAEEGRELRATLVISRAINPSEILRPDLKSIPAFANAFSITDVPDTPPTEGVNEVRFTYQLKPRNRSVTEIPALKFYYFNPTAAPNKAFPMTMAEAVPITVTEPPPPPLVRMMEDDRLFHVATGRVILKAPLAPGLWAWLGLGLFCPLAAGTWYLAWRRSYPGEARLTRLRWIRAARRAADAIRRADRGPDPPAAIAAALLGYLRVRFPHHDGAVTPSEIAAALVDAEVPDAVASRVALVFRATDRARFAPSGEGASALATSALAAISLLEAHP